MKTGMTIYWEINNTKRKIEILQMKIVDHTPGSEQHAIMENRLKSLRVLLDSLIDVEYEFGENKVKENIIYDKPSPLQSVNVFDVSNLYPVVMGSGSFDGGITFINPKFVE